MLKKIIGTQLLLILFQVVILLGVSGCSKEKELSPISQTQGDLVKPSQASGKSSSETSSETSNTTGSPSYQKPIEVPVLYYHSVLLEEGNKVRMPPDQFEAQMIYLRDKGYETVSLGQLYQALYKGGDLPAKPVVITFDDGYEDNYTIAFPILKKYGFTASVFVVSSYINGKGFMSGPQLKELIANGWEIEGHTVSHSHLTRMDKQTVIKELKNSKERLEEVLGRPVNFFAYPYGDVNTDVAQAVKDTGYLMAFTTERGWVNLNLDEWHLQRVYCFADMGLNEFSRRLQDPNY